LFSICLGIYKIFYYILNTILSYLVFCFVFLYMRIIIIYLFYLIFKLTYYIFVITIYFSLCTYLYIYCVWLQHSVACVTAYRISNVLNFQWFVSARAQLSSSSFFYLKANAANTAYTQHCCPLLATAAVAPSHHLHLYQSLLQLHKLPMLFNVFLTILHNSQLLVRKQENA